MKKLELPIKETMLVAALPLQSLPPYAGLGLLQARARVFAPRPQVALHGPNALHADHWPSVGQGVIVQLRVCSARPSHTRPPFLGTGVVQERRLTWAPVLHDTLHGPYGLHRVHWG